VGWLGCSWQAVVPADALQAEQIKAAWLAPRKLKRHIQLAAMLVACLPTSADVML
jgi:hypothetical protein